MEGGVSVVFRGEDLGDAVGDVGDLLGEAGDGGLPVDFVGLTVLEEEGEDFEELFGLVNGCIEGDAVVLIEDGAGGGLEEDVGEGVAFGDLLLDLGLQVVGGVFGFPEAVDEGEVIDGGRHRHVTVACLCP